MDKERFVQEIEACSQMLYRVSYAMLHHHQDCQDAMQEATLKAWQKRGSLRNPQQFRTWLTRILINECYNIQRKRPEQIPLDMAPEQAVPPEDPGLALVVQAMPEKLRLPLVLRYAESMSYHQIARVLRLSLPTVRGRLYRAKQYLRKELAV